MKKALCSLVVAITLAAAPFARADFLHDQGAGMYVDASTAQQLSTFSINNQLVTCGVGTLAAGVWSGPFAMLMYSTAVTNYTVDRISHMITASGKMRSITRVGGLVVEDVEHDFMSIAVDNDTGGPDRFDTHFKTAFWNTGNPMCTPSDKIVGGCRFGGTLTMGEVSIDQ